jgi:iron complex outermembrane receptor protein
VLAGEHLGKPRTRVESYPRTRRVALFQDGAGTCANRFVRALGILAALSVSSVASAQQMALLSDLGALKQMSLDDLMDIEVTSVSRHAEPFGRTAAALSVITADDISHSGATSVPELLRGVPGIHVARQSTSGWAVSARGFASVASEKLLVQSDTRSIYTPLFSGVLWDAQDYLLADIERIEVIRGPGAALWGSNAVNGVINITTKSARDTHGTRLEASAGTEERVMVAVRHGGETRGGIHFRVFGKYFEQDDTLTTAESSDEWQLGHLGFRADWASGAQDEFTVQGDWYRGKVGKLVPAITIIGRPGPTGQLVANTEGGNILGRWRRTFSDTSDLQFRAYYDRTHRDDPSFTDDLHTADLDLQHRFAVGSRHEFVWGANYRYTSNNNEGKGLFAVVPESSKDQLFSAFVQDQISWHNVRVTLGAKAEHNDFSGFELQPSVRAAWDINDRQMLWAAISRAARIPTRLERDIFVNATDPTASTVYRLLGNRDFEAEELTASELGYRWRATDSLHLDVALFDNYYNGLSSLEIGTVFVDTDGRTIIPVVNRNLTDGRARGVETLVTYAATENWRLSASHSFFTMKLDPAGLDLNRGDYFEGATPRNQFALTSSITLPRGFALDAQFRRISAVRRIPVNPTGEGIPGYSELDVQLSWQATQEMRISVVGQNLLHDHHVEFGTPEARGAIQRGVYVKFVWER